MTLRVDIINLILSVQLFSHFNIFLYFPDIAIQFSISVNTYKKLEPTCSHIFYDNEENDTNTGFCSIF